MDLLELEELHYHLHAHLAEWFIPKACTDDQVAERDAGHRACQGWDARVAIYRPGWDATPRRARRAATATRKSREN